MFIVLTDYDQDQCRFSLLRQNVHFSAVKVIDFVDSGMGMLEVWFN